VGNDNDDEDKNLSDEDGDASDSEDEMDIDVEQLPRQAVEFKIDPNIDINAQVLKDMVSADPIAREPAQLQSTLAGAAESSVEEPNWNW
jgi:hypothetical protein